MAEIDKSTSEIAVDVVVDNVENLGGFQFVMSFDDGVLAFQDARKGAFLASTSREAICNDPVIQGGSLRMSCVTLRDTPPGPNGSGTLATIRFTPKSSGVSPVTLSSTKLVHPDGSLILSSTQDSQIVITGGSGGLTKTVAVIGGTAAAIVAVLAVAYVWLRRRRRRAPASG